MTANQLNVDSITFGKYNGKSLTSLLKDRSYCKWLKEQEWFQREYTYLYNRVCEYNPKSYFVPSRGDEYKNLQQFLDEYPYFNLTIVNDLKINLTEDEIKCYIYYINTIQDLKTKITLQSNTDNPYDIKAPVKWLQRFETETELNRSIFKQFLNEYDLDNITTILENIKQKGGIEYKGARSYKIAKERSEKQEQLWENRLRKKYGEDISVQFKYRNCFFDFLHIHNKVIYECKLGIKDFNQEQYEKYLVTLGDYNMIYLIGRDIVINMKKKLIVVKRGLHEFERSLYTLSGPFIDLISDYQIKTLQQDVDNLLNYI